MGPLLKLIRSIGGKKAPAEYQMKPGEKTRRADPQPRTERGPEAERRHVESLFDIPAPYRDHAMEINARMLELEKAHAAGKSGMTEREFSREMMDLHNGRHEMMRPENHKQGLFRDGYFAKPDPEPEIPQWYFDMKYKGQ